MYPMIHAKGRSPVAWELRPYERSRSAKHGGIWNDAVQRVPAPPGVVMLAPPTVPRNASREQSKARAQEGFQKARPLPNLTPSPLNVVNAHCSLFKAYPLVRAAKCLDTRASRRNDKRLEGNGGPSGDVPHCLRR
jgi:hypothetical protein